MEDNSRNSDKCIIEACRSWAISSCLLSLPSLPLSPFLKGERGREGRERRQLLMSHAVGPSYHFKHAQRKPYADKQNTK